MPIPSLDGYGVIEPWLPTELQLRLRKFSTPALLFLFMLLWYVKPLGLFLGNLSATIAQILGVPIDMIGVGFTLFNKSSGILLLAAIGAVLLIRRVTSKPHKRWHDKGNTLSKSGRYEKAIASLDKVLQTKPNHYQLWYKRGKLLTLLNQDEEALSSYDKAVHIKPDFAQAWIHRGSVLNDLKRYEEALSSYNKAIQITPDDPAIWTEKGVALGRLQKYGEAMLSFDQAIQIEPRYALAWHNKACCYAEQKNVGLAIKTLKQAVNIAPNLVKELAKKDSSFDAIRGNKLFKQLISK